MLVAELIREAALEGVRDELPHSIAVVVEEMIPEGGLTKIYADVYVERHQPEGDRHRRPGQPAQGRSAPAPAADRGAARHAGSTSTCTCGSPRTGSATRSSCAGWASDLGGGCSSRAARAGSPPRCGPAWTVRCDCSTSPPAGARSRRAGTTWCVGDLCAAGGDGLRVRRRRRGRPPGRRSRPRRRSTDLLRVNVGRDPGRPRGGRGGGRAADRPGVLDPRGRLLPTARRRRAEELPATAPPRPDSYYGWTKAAMESLGRLYADRFGMAVFALRIGGLHRPARPDPPRLVDLAGRRRAARRGVPRRPGFRLPADLGSQRQPRTVVVARRGARRSGIVPRDGASAEGLAGR